MSPHKRVPRSRQGGETWHPLFPRRHSQRDLAKSASPPEPIPADRIETLARVSIALDQQAKRKRCSHGRRKPDRALAFQ